MPWFAFRLWLANASVAPRSFFFRGPSSPSSFHLRGHQNCSKYIHLEYPGDRVVNPGHAQPHRSDHYPLALCRVAKHPYLPAFSAKPSFTSNLPKPRNGLCFARAAVVRYRERRGVLQDMEEEPKKCSRRTCGSRMFATFASQS